MSLSNLNNRLQKLESRLGGEGSSEIDFIILRGVSPNDEIAATVSYMWGYSKRLKRGFWFVPWPKTEEEAWERLAQTEAEFLKQSGAAV